MRCADLLNVVHEDIQRDNRDNFHTEKGNEDKRYVDSPLMYEPLVGERMMEEVVAVLLNH